MSFFPLMHGFLAGIKEAGSVVSLALAQWGLDDPDEITANSSIGNYPGTYVGGVTHNVASLTSGGIGLAVTLDGSTGYVDFGTNTDFDFERDDPFSLEVWIKHDTISVNEKLFNRQSAVSPFPGWQLSMHTIGQLRFNISSATVSNLMRVDTVNTFDDDQIHHVVVTYDGTSAASGVHIYVDGVDQTLITGNDTLSANVSTPANSLFLGVRPDEAGAFWNGSLDDPAIYTFELTQAQVSENFLAGST